MEEFWRWNCEIFIAMNKNNNEFFNFELFDNKTLRLKYIKKPKKPFIADASPLGFIGIGYIQIDNLFFTFSSKERQAIIAHEYWQYKNTFYYEIKKFWLIFCINKIKKLQELEADIYAAKKIGIDPTLSMLKKIKQMIEQGKIDYDYKTHPPIDERIANVMKLKSLSNKIN